MGDILGWLPGGEAVGAVCQELWPSIHQDSACQFSFGDNGVSSSSTGYEAVINLQAFIITFQKPLFA